MGFITMRHARYQGPASPGVHHGLEEPTLHRGGGTALGVKSTPLEVDLAGKQVLDFEGGQPQLRNGSEASRLYVNPLAKRKAFERCSLQVRRLSWGCDADYGGHLINPRER